MLGAGDGGHVTLHVYIYALAKSLWRQDRLNATLSWTYIYKIQNTKYKKTQKKNIEKRNTYSFLALKHTDITPNNNQMHMNVYIRLYISDQRAFTPILHDSLQEFGMPTHVCFIFIPGY